MSPAPVPAPATTVVERRNCPSRLASHEQVVNKRELFFETLKSLHSSLGTKLMVPVIGRKELDLHILYVEVTRRGGYDKVVLEKKWREISSIFNFAPTTTSASFVLKKHYHNLLYQYEQVYFFDSKEPISSTPQDPKSLGGHVCGADVTDHDEYTSRVVQDSPYGDSDPLSIPAVGTIVGKFDCGYLVSVKLGNELLCGVLYHPDEPLAPSDTVEEDLSMAIVPYDPSQAPSPVRKRRLKRKRWGGDPSHPKPNRSGYNFFFAEKHFALKSQFPNREREFTKMIGEAWNKLNPEERSVYQEIGLRDKERYRRELKEYHERLAARRSMEN